MILSHRSSVTRMLYDLDVAYIQFDGRCTVRDLTVVIEPSQYLNN